MNSVGVFVKGLFSTSRRERGADGEGNKKKPREKLGRLASSFNLTGVYRCGSNAIFFLRAPPRNDIGTAQSYLAILLFPSCSLDMKMAFLANIPNGTRMFYMVRDCFFNTAYYN